MKSVSPLKISLVFPPFFLESLYNLPPLGIITLATALKSSPHHVAIHDFVLQIRLGKLELGPRIYQDCAEKILEGSPDLVGFSAQCTTYPAVIQISRLVKKRSPRTKIIVGGHNSTFVDVETLERFPFVDAIVRGEGEITFVEMVNALAEGRGLDQVDGLTFRSGKEIVRNPDRGLLEDLDLIPLPDYSLVPPLSVYKSACNLSRSIAILEVGRGCPHRCVYCSESILWRRRTRTFSVPRIVEEMEFLHCKHGAECFVLAYDQFTANRHFVEEFCSLVIQKGLNHIPWYCISRLDTVDEALLRTMRQAGCESMCYGIDSGSKKTLAFIRKKINQEILYQRVVETAEQGIVPTLSFVIGFPEEERADIDDTLTLALRAGIVGNNNPLIQMPTVLPGTELHERYLASLVRRVDTYFALGLEFFNGKRLPSDEDLINSSPEIFSSFYNLPCKGMDLYELDLIATYFPLVVQLYPRSFLLTCIEYEKSPSELFIKFLSHVKIVTNKKEFYLSAKECYDYFSRFLTDKFLSRQPPSREYFEEVLRYEDMANEAAREPFEPLSSDIPQNELRAIVPEARKGIFLGEFDFPLPLIIFDFKAGSFHNNYEKKKTYVVFRQTGEQLDVLEVNRFVADFLSLADGSLNLQAIAENLWHRGGPKGKKEDFIVEFIEAVKILGEEGFVAFH